jgi:starch phosphorylase
MAKLIIKLINDLGTLINQDRAVKGRLKVVFFPDFNVKNAQFIYPAADLSEQISTAGKEASGTGNMKFAMNGALTIGTLDGANVEIREHVGSDHFFLFGLDVDQVHERQSQGYNPREHYDRDPLLRQAIDFIASGALSRGDPSIFRPLVDSLLNQDRFMVLADFAAYIKAQSAVTARWRDEKAWTRASILNTARMGYFSSDRSIRDYCRQVWSIKLPD